MANYYRLAGFQDPSKVQYILEMMKGYAKMGTTLDARLPITLPILLRIVQASVTICNSHYEITMFKAMCSLAFFAFLRIGEITACHGAQDENILQVSQVEKITGPNRQVSALQITFYNFKHQYNKSPFSIVVSRQASLCPVQSMLDYLAIRGPQMGPLFMTSDGCHVLRSKFSTLLDQCIRSCNLNPARYKGHSFRIGAATHAAIQGLSDAKIRLLGRWKSDAFKRYIRVQSLPSV